MAHLPSELKVAMAGAGDGSEGSVRNAELEWEGQIVRAVGVGGGGDQRFRGVREDGQD